MFACAHQHQLDLVLDVFDVQGATRGHTAQVSGFDHVGEAFAHFPNSGTARRLATLDGQEGLGHCDRDLGAVKRYYNAVTLDDPKGPGANLCALIKLGVTAINWRLSAGAGLRAQIHNNSLAPGVRLANIILLETQDIVVLGLRQPFM